MAWRVDGPRSALVQAVAGQLDAQWAVLRRRQDVVRRQLHQDEAGGAQRAHTARRSYGRAFGAGAGRVYWLAVAVGVPNVDQLVHLKQVLDLVVLHRAVPASRARGGGGDQRAQLHVVVSGAGVKRQQFASVEMAVVRVGRLQDAADWMCSERWRQPRRTNSANVDGLVVHQLVGVALEQRSKQVCRQVRTKLQRGAHLGQNAYGRNDAAVDAVDVGNGVAHNVLHGARRFQSHDESEAHRSRKIRQ